MLKVEYKGILQINKKKIQWINWFEWVLHKRGYSNCQWTYEKCLTSPVTPTIQIKIIMTYHCATKGMKRRKNMENIKCLQGYGTTGTF